MFDEKQCLWKGQKLVAGHLQQKKGYYYAVITYKEDDKPTSKWFSTGMKVKGNKRKAEDFLLDMRIKFTEQLRISSMKALFNMEEKVDESMKIELSVICKKWLNYKEHIVQKTTFAGYHHIINHWILPYVEKHSIYVDDVGKRYIQDYIEYLYENDLSHKTVRNHRGVFNSIFEYAIAHEFIDSNPCAALGSMKKSAPIEKYLTEEEALRLLSTVEDTVIEYPVYMACIYGLRRSEVVGLKWSAVDFKRHTFAIEHVVVEVAIKGRPLEYHAKDETKNTEKRSYPLVPIVENMLLKLKEQQTENLKQKPDYVDSGYVYVNELGEVRKPRYITKNFSKHLAQNGFKHIRFHDLRHSCASILLADPSRAVSLKDIQVWLGHSDIDSTMRYAHIAESKSKEHTAELTRAIYG